jgi:hypothetical protein
MTLKPLESISRANVGVVCGYSILYKGKGSPTLSISINADLVRKLKIRDRDPLRLDGDLTERMARLTPVTSSNSKATRKLVISKSGRGEWQIPYNGMIAEAFPAVKSMTPLNGAEVTSDGLLFQLPPLA